MKVIKVGMADLAVSKSPCIITTLGLGSCVGIVLYDRKNKIGGLAHIMLPSSLDIKNNSNKAKFADTAIEILIEEMIKIGANKNDLVAKLAGGSQMFKFSTQNEILRIGDRNVIASKKKLKEYGIRIVAEDTGGNYGRTIELNCEDGSLMVRTIGRGCKYI
ncbi:chemotaxis protein CheD [Caloranaerobacter ferrireducens]|uniref:chemotaxis protein CheD n=1 Tax=Caloranaerobacter ferrireducens TaxID=1323370 RepID=UPI00084D69A6|nr:chemotaxis protein CheD [Caloranaerobacter ferrireducens]